MIKELKAGTAVKLNKLENEAHRTTPPARYTEVSLISKLSDLGIGRPSTYASIVSLIQARGYVKKKGTALYPTPVGFAVVRLLSNKLPLFLDYGYTSKMEEELDSIIDGSQTREKFLANFWNGGKGFDVLVNDLIKNIDFEEIKGYSTIDLLNGYAITFNRFGTYLQDSNGEPNEKGYLPSVRIDEDALIDDYLDPESNKELLEKATSAPGPRELGILTSGTYKDWFVSARDGKFGAYVQAVSPTLRATLAAGKKATPTMDKPVNQTLPEDLDINTIELKDIENLYAEVKLPRTLSENFFVGIGKRGPWLARKANAKARKAVFVSLPGDLNPRTVTLLEAEKVWEEKEIAKKSSKDKKPPAASPPAKKTAAKKPAKKVSPKK